MITRIELTNFMSHRHTVIEPSAGLTVLVGPNNVGKSAVVAAMQILCQNETATHVLRHGERECSVSVQTDDGHSVVWRRKNSPSYIIDGQVFDRLRRGGIPGELHQALRLPKVDSETGSDSDFDVHFGEQKSPIFLLKSPANAARFFASSSDAIKLVGMQKLHKERLGDRQKEKSRLEAESKTVNEQLEFLQPVVHIDEQVEIAERDYIELGRFDAWHKEAVCLVEALEIQIAEAVQNMAFAEALSGLAAPPVLGDSEPFARLIAEISKEETRCESGESRAAVLGDLGAPPEFAKTEYLSGLIHSLQLAESRRSAAASRAAALQEVPLPPHLEDVASLSAIRRGIALLAETVERSRQEQATFSGLTGPPLLADIRELQRLIGCLKMSTRGFAVATSEVNVLQAVAPPCQMLDEVALAMFVASLAKASFQRDRGQALYSSLAFVAEPPVPADLSNLAQAVFQFELAAEQVQTTQAKALLAESEVQQAEDELRERAEGSECPICGNTLNADAVFARTAAGLGGHTHA